MSKEELYRFICGDDRECAEELARLPQALAEVDSKVKKIAENRGGSLADIPVGLMEYARRRLNFYVKGGGGTGGICSVCNTPATLVVLERKDYGIFEGFTAKARCICGSEWPFKPWTCPKCGAEGREQFKVYLLGPGRIMRCNKCGYHFAELEATHDIQTPHALYLLAITEIKP